MSILAVDFGSVHTRAVLMDQVGGVFELVGFARTRTTDTYPAQNVRLGLDRVLAQLSDVTGRIFVSPEGGVISPEQPDRSGVDTFVVTASGGRPLRAVVAGLMPDLSVKAAKEALSNSYVEVVETLSLQDGRTPNEWLNAVLHCYPNVILITGGTDGGATESVMTMVRAVKLAVSVMDKRRRPTVIYAGNGVLIPAVQAEFENVSEVLIAPNVRPKPGKLQVGGTRALLAEAFNRYAETRGMGFSDLAALSPDGVQLSARGYATVTAYLAKLRGEKVIALDVGSAASVLSVATPRASEFAIRTDLGLGHNAPHLLQAVGANAIQRWLPFEASSEDILSYAMNKSLRPGIVPFSLRETYYEHALLKAAVGEIADDTSLGSAPTADLVILGGAALNETGHPAYSALLAIDALGLRGVTKIWGDPFGLTAALGAVAETRAEAAAQVLEGTGYTVLATTICASGSVRPEKPALQVTVEPEFGQAQTFTINGGHLVTVPLPLGDKATVRVKTLMRGLDIDGKTSIKVKLSGGGAGIIIDARGRPLASELTVAQKVALMPQWIADVTGDERLEVPAPAASKSRPKPPAETPPPSSGESAESLSPARQRQLRREQRRNRPPETPLNPPEEPSIEDLRNALS